MATRTEFARRAVHFRPSPVRSVWDVAAAPGMISFAGGNPDITGLPLAELGDSAARLIRDHGATVLQYGAGQGLASLREELVAMMTNAGITADPGDVLVTSGSQMGLELVTAMYCDPGDVVLAEAPTYVGALSTFAGLETAVEHVACDDDGIIPEALQARITSLKAEGRRVKLLYTIPNFNNPSGITLSASRRPAIAEICARAGITVVEDDPYGRVRFDGETIPPIRAHDADVIYLGSLSKIFSPGIRIGWVLAPASVRARLQLLSEATTIHASTLSQHLAVEYLRAMPWEQVFIRTLARYRERAHTLLEELSASALLPAGTTWTVPKGGFFVWVTLPPGFSGDELFARAVEHKVVFISGDAFFANGSGTRNFRLSYSLTPPDTIREGVRRLAAAARDITRHESEAPDA